MASSYGPVFDELIPADRVCELGPGRPNEAMRPKFSRFVIASAFLHATFVADEDAAWCCVCGVWLLHDFLHESHEISQQIETPDGSYWHGIMHRREPDYGNSKYWFRRVGNHAVFPQLLTAAQKLIAAEGAQDSIAREIAQADQWDPYRFIDWCEELARGKVRQRTLAEKIAQAEWRLLFADCYERAIGLRQT